MCNAGYKIAGFRHRKSEKIGDGNDGELAVNTAIHLASISTVILCGRSIFPVSRDTILLIDDLNIALFILNIQFFLAIFGG